VPNDWLAAQPRWMLLALLLAIGAAGVILAFSVRSAIKRRAAARPDPRAARAARAQPPRQQIEVRGAAIDGGEALRRQTVTLDSKAARLEILIRQADERIAALSGAVSAAPRRGPDAAPPDAHGRTTPAPAPALRPRPPDPLTLAVYQRADSGLTTVEIARELDEQVGKVELILALRGPR
jgi:hypothetical protein